MSLASIIASTFAVNSLTDGSEAVAHKNPASFLISLDETRVSEQLYMAADARLALPEKLGEVFHVEFTALQQTKDAQARWFRRRAQSSYDVVKARHARVYDL